MNPITVVQTNIVADFEWTPESPYLYEPVTFTDLSTSSPSSLENWTWDFGDGDSTSNTTGENVEHLFTTSGEQTVTLTVQDSDGCLGVIIYVVFVRDDIIVPNVFTPNGDGVNDEFVLLGNPFQSFDFRVYNRWGVLVHEQLAGNGPVKWDGSNNDRRTCTDGTYYFVVKGVVNNEAIEITGYISLQGGE